MNQIPQTLVDQLKRGEVTLFLGAGASYGSSKPDGTTIMMGDQLRDALCREFLNGNELNRTLKTVANFVENEFGLLKLNNFIADCFSGFKPNSGLEKLPNFRWASIYTTNYDLLVEDSYNIKTTKQPLVPFYKDLPTIDKDLAATANSLPLFKLHGSIDNLHDRNAPLVITTTSYVDVKAFRKGVFDRLIDDVHKRTVVFIGTQLADSHIEEILADVEKQYGKERPMHYIVSPTLTNYDVSYFSGRRITCIINTIDDFIEEIDNLIDEKDVIISGAIGKKKHPIQSHFKNHKDVPPDLLEFIENKVDYVYSAVSGTQIDASSFYKGMSESWTPVQESFDFQRRGYESLILKVLLQSEEHEASVDVITITGVAGSGKTTLLRRLAFDLSAKHGELVLYAEPEAVLRTSPFLQLYENTQKRVILLVDNAADQMTDIVSITGDLAKLDIPATIIIADTKASFGDRLDQIDGLIRQTRNLGRLSDDEISRLIEKLDKNNSLGQLKGATDEQRIDAFNNLADKQLLVALYEATQGKPLEELLVDEYHRILLTEAQELYLMVATLHRFNIPVRAGLISRAMGIHFHEFEHKFLGPLTDLVYTEMDQKSRDYVYRTRHPQVAEIIFRRILDTQSKQINQYATILENLNPTYSSDDQALKRLLSANSLIELTTNTDERRRLLDIAHRAMPNNVFVIQQKALLEMNTRTGDLQYAEELLEEAKSLSPNNHSLVHTQATLLARKAQASKDQLRAKTFRVKARNLLKGLQKKVGDDAYVQISLAKLTMDEIEAITKNEDLKTKGAPNRILMGLIDDVERELSLAEKSMIHGETVTKLRVKLRKILNDKGRAISLIENALEKTPDSRRLAVSYFDAVKRTSPEKARDAIKQAMLAYPNDKKLNQSLFLSLLEENDIFSDELLGPLTRAFTLEDDNVRMHVHALRYHFVRGEHEAYDKTLIASEKVRERLNVSNKPILEVSPSCFQKEVFDGTITKIRPYFCFIKCSLFENDLFCASRFVDTDVWDQLVTGNSVIFDLAFNLKGALAINLKIPK